jgi:hypothetical protein
MALALAKNWNFGKLNCVKIKTAMLDYYNNESTFNIPVGQEEGGIVP